MRVNGLQSRSIDVMRFAMILLVVVLHAYTSTRSDFSAGDFPVYRLVSFVCSLEIAQTAVPALFFISGFLFFLHPKPYKTKLRKTSKRLIVPYLLWNALILALYFGVEQIPALSKYFSGVNPPVSGYSFVNFLQAFWDSGEWRGGNGTPILHQFWYIRNLILLALLSPAIRLFVRGFGWWGAAALWGVWLATPGQAFLIESLAFFTAGACFSLRHTDFLSMFSRFATTTLLLYITLMTVHMIFRDNGLVPLDRVVFTLGIIVGTNLSVRFVTARERRETPHSIRARNYPGLRGMGFFLFALHDPMLTLLKRIAMKLSGTPSDFSLTVIYILIPLLVIAIAVGLYRLLNRHTPSLLKTLTGR